MNAPTLNTFVGTPHYNLREIADRILHCELFRNFQKGFAAATGLPLDFVGTDDCLRMPYVGHDNESDFCRLLREGTGNAWETANAIFLTRVQQDREAQTLTTIGGLRESAVPVRCRNVTVGYLRTGQALVSQPSEAGFSQVMEQLSARRGLFDLVSLREAYFEIPVIPLNRYSGLVEIVRVFSVQLEEHINRLMLMKRPEEPEAVRHAKKFIVENLDEALTLDNVASHAGISSFYFCRLFKSATGMTLTEFVGRLRIEKAKQLMLNPQFSRSPSPVLAPVAPPWWFGRSP